MRDWTAEPRTSRQLDTAIDWGRWAGLFDYDADDGSFLKAGEPRA